MQIVELDNELVDEIYQGVDPFSEEGTEVFKAWCADNNVFYYGRPGFQFSKDEGIQLAIDACANAVILEDLS